MTMVSVTPVENRFLSEIILMIKLIYFIFLSVEGTSISDGKYKSNGRTRYIFGRQ